MNKFTGISAKRLKNLFIAMALITLPFEQALAQNDGRYSFKYPGDFFSPGGAEVEFDAPVHDKIGVLVTNRTTRSLSEITSMIFNTSPFDRYKQFFTFALKMNFVRTWQTIIPFPPGLMIITAGR